MAVFYVILYINVYFILKTSLSPNLNKSHVICEIFSTVYIDYDYPWL